VPTDLANLKIDSELSTRLEEFLARCQNKINEHFAERFKSLAVPTLEIDPGRRFLRIVVNRGDTTRYVYCFIDITNGDVLKSEGWKKPAKHARGNLYNDDFGAADMTPYGAPYLR